MSNLGRYHGATKANMDATEVLWEYNHHDDKHSVVTSREFYDNKTIVILFDVDDDINTSKTGKVFGFCCHTEFKKRLGEDEYKPNEIPVYSSLEDTINEKNENLLRLDCGSTLHNRLQDIYYTAVYNKKTCLIGFPIWSKTRYDNVVANITKFGGGEQIDKKKLFFFLIKNPEEQSSFRIFYFFLFTKKNKPI